uniref:Uncharacterized protein n=1 Tax=Cannabis sativa TaxID=3483 RepID=A0A803PFE8_CANSA
MANRQNQSEHHKASGSNNGGGGGSPVTAANLGQQMSIPNNQGSHLLPNIQGNNGADLIRNLRGKEKEDGLNNVKSLETGEVIGEKQLLAPTGENSKNGLTFLENKRRRTGLSDIIGLDEDNVDEEQYKAHDNILYADMEITKDSEKDLQGLIDKLEALIEGREAISVRVEEQIKSMVVDNLDMECIGDGNSSSSGDNKPSIVPMKAEATIIMQGTPKSYWFDDQEETIILNCDATITEGLPRCGVGALIRSKQGLVLGATAISRSDFLLVPMAECLAI